MARNGDIDTKIIIFNGYPRSGKDTAADYLISMNDNIKKYTTVSLPKQYLMDINKYFGINGLKKDAKTRKCLSDIKDALTEWNDIPLKYLLNEIKEDNPEYAIVMCREPKEIEKIVKLYDASTVLFIRDNFYAEKASNHSDAEVMNYSYDYIIYNNSDLDNLYSSIDTLMSAIRRRKEDK